jgi:hypothetical protein
MCEAAKRDGEVKADREVEHDRRNRSQLELLKLAYERKRHRDYIEELRRRTTEAVPERSTKDADDASE